MNCLVSNSLSNVVQRKDVHVLEHILQYLRAIFPGRESYYFIRSCKQKIGFKHFLFPPLDGEDSHFDEAYFIEMGWFNDQLASDLGIHISSA